MLLVALKNTCLLVKENAIPEAPFNTVLSVPEVDESLYAAIFFI